MTTPAAYGYAPPPLTGRPAAVAPPTGTAPAPGGRDRYFDLLRALALFRVVAYHLFGWAWLPLIFPSMGVMFALAGSLMARSLKRPALSVLRGRLRRLLPPLWLLGAVGVTGMILQGWGPSSEGHPGWWWFHLVYWVLPLSDPPYPESLPGIHGILGDTWPADLAGPLWYIRAYLWYVLLSPLLLRAMRRLPWATVLFPLALAVLCNAELVELPTRIDSALTDFSTFGACWMLGLAHTEGVLRRLPRYVVPSIAPWVMLVGLWWALRSGFREGFDLDSIPLAQAIWSFGAVLLLLHVSPSWSTFPPRIQRWNGLISLLNSRAMTVYLWHNVCLLVAATAYDLLWGVPALADHVPWLLDSAWPVLAFGWLLIFLCILLFGWVEDVAAKRPPRLFPWPRAAARGRGRTA